MIKQARPLSKFPDPAGYRSRTLFYPYLCDIDNYTAMIINALTTYKAIGPDDTYRHVNASQTATHEMDNPGRKSCPKEQGEINTACTIVEGVINPEKRCDITHHKGGFEDLKM